MTNTDDFGIEAHEAAEVLGISVDDAYELPIPVFQEPDGDIWYRRSDVERLKRKRWKPKPPSNRVSRWDEEECDWWPDSS